MIKGLDDVDLQGFDWLESQYQGLATWMGHAGTSFSCMLNDTAILHSHHDSASK